MIRALIILLPAIAVIGLGWLLGLAVYRARSRALRDQLAHYRAEAKSHAWDAKNVRQKLTRVRELAEINQAVDPILSAQILAEITPTERHPQ